MTYGDVMKIEPSISLPVLLVGVIVGGNIAYQIGFYSSLGFQFISMTPLGDWLTVALALAPFYIAMALNSLAFLTVYRNAPHRRRILDRFIIQSERTLGRIAAAAFMVSLMVFNGSSRPQLWLTLISLFVAMALVPMQFVTFFSISLEDSEAFWRRVGVPSILVMGWMLLVRQITTPNVFTRMHHTCSKRKTRTCSLLPISRGRTSNRSEPTSCIHSRQRGEGY